MLLLLALPGLKELLIGFLVLCLVVGVAYWLITNLLPPPIQKWAIAVLLVIVVIVLISFLTGGGGGSLGF